MMVKHTYARKTWSRTPSTMEQGVKESSLVKAKSCRCCPWGILAGMDYEESVESKAVLVWSGFSPSFPAICFNWKAVSLMKRDRGC